MVNSPETLLEPDRRARTRAPVEPVTLGSANLNPFGDLHTLQHLTARLARGLRGLFEPILRRELRTWAEPLVVQHFADYRAERPEGLTAWLPLRMAQTSAAAGQALAVFDGRFVFELLDLFFGGAGEVPHHLPTEFSPAADAMVAQLGGMLADPLAAAWEPVARVRFEPQQCEANPAMLSGIDADDAMIVTRIGIAKGHAAPAFIDVVYPVAALKPHAPSLTGKVHAKTAAPDAQWQNALTRAVMGVRFPLRSVLAEPVISLDKLMSLKVGDVIPVNIAGDVPVMVGGDRFAAGTVGASNGKAAIRLNTIDHPLEDFQ